MVAHPAPLFHPELADFNPAYRLQWYNHGRQKNKRPTSCSPRVINLHMMYKSGHEAPIQQTTIKCTIKKRKTKKVSFKVIYTRRHERKGYVMIGFLSWPFIHFVTIPGRF